MWLILGNVFNEHFDPSKLPLLLNYTAQVALGQAVSKTLQSFFGDM